MYFAGHWSYCTFINSTSVVCMSSHASSHVSDGGVSYFRQIYSLPLTFQLWVCLLTRFERFLCSEIWVSENTWTSFRPKLRFFRLILDLCPQRQVHHPFVHDLQDCWQTQRHIYISESARDEWPTNLEPLSRTPALHPPLHSTPQHQ